MTTEENKAEVLKYHPAAHCVPRHYKYFVFTQSGPFADLLGGGQTESEAWEQAALNAARMS